MASSQHRPGAKVTKSPAAYAKEALQQIDQLEKQLNSLPPKGNEDQKSALRMQLCEKLSEVILKDPLIALKHDCVGRLWRNCFYDSINLHRSRISKEKKKNGPNLDKIQRSLARNLSEAVALYDYLISHYHNKLIGASATPGSQQSSQSLSQSSFNDSQQSQAASTDTAGVVAGLFKMYIHLGDLHRYACKYKESQQSYVSASKLSPGRGNPYNQLAVVSQLKDTAAPLNTVALYWYARSLLTTDEPFEISKANLARLFQSNRDWFQKQPPPPEEVLKPNTGNGKQELPKAVRSVASRHFLSQFVDLHFNFFQGIVSSSKGKASQDLPTDEEVIAQIEASLSPLSVLLRSSAFGDPLLCKLVAICAFSESYRPDKNDEIDLVLTRFLSRMYTLSFGACLAERVSIGLAKIKDQPEKIGNPGKAPSSVRLLQPLLLVCEYVESCPSEMKTDKLSARTASFCETAINTFWQRFAEVLNLLSHLRGPLDLDRGDWQNVRIKEFQGLIGYAPFVGFLKDPMASSREDGYASIEEAIDALELSSPEHSSQDSTSSPAEEYKVKVARLLALGDRMAADTSNSASRRLWQNSNGAFVWNETQEDDADSDDPMMDIENTNENDTQPLPAGKGDDVLVYSVPQGGGPALLVPGMLLQNRTLGSTADDPATGQKPSTASEGIGGPPLAVGIPVSAPVPAPSVTSPVSPFGAADPRSQNPPAAAPPASIMPPPGFGGGPQTGMMAAPAMPPGQRSNPSAPPHVTGLPATGLGSGMTMGFGQGLAPAMQPQQQPSYQPSLANSTHLFGGPAAFQTENPFAAASMPALDAGGNMTMMDLNLSGAPDTSGSGALFFNSGASGVPSSTSTLLGSGLLNSLFEDSGDKTSHNPFAT